MLFNRGKQRKKLKMCNSGEKQKRKKKKKLFLTIPEAKFYFILKDTQFWSLIDLLAILLPKIKLYVRRLE